jgi:pimeloyl-ACP methyl ester carboxylesterase
MVVVNGTKMRLDCRGSGGPTVLLEAGAQSSSRVWVKIQDDVAQFTRVCSYDRAGYGWSDPVLEAMLPQQVADMLHALLDEAGEQPPYLMVGHSFGGVYVRTFAAQYPHEVVGMVLVDSSHESQIQDAPPAMAQSPEYTRLQEAQAASLRVLQIAEPIGLLRAFRMFDASVSTFPEQEKGLALAEMYRTGYIGANRRESEMMNAYSGQPEPLGDIPLVVLSLQTDAQEMYEQYQPIFPETVTMEMAQQLADNYNANQDELAGLSPQGNRIIVEDCGHFIQLEKPGSVIDAIRQVFGRVAD